MISRSAADLKAGHSTSPGRRRSHGSPGPSSRTAGRQRISHWSAERSAIFRSSRPARSSRCQRVWVSTIQASAESRVYRSLVYHSQTRCRMTGLSASSRLPKGSSMIAPSAAVAGDRVAHPGRAQAAAVAGDLEEVHGAAGLHPGRAMRAHLPVERWSRERPARRPRRP